MRSFWSDPYLWIHLAGLAAVPLFLELCFLGLAVGDPVLPVVLEVLFVAVVGIAPILWMQWQRPFCIFSLVALAVKPEFLTEQQRRMLRLFKNPESRALAGGVAIALLFLLWQLYRFAPIGTEAASLLPQTRLVGLGLAAIAFLFCNLFVQVPLSVVRVMLASDLQLASITPYPVDQIAKDFTLLGLRVKHIVPPLLADEPKPPKAVPSPSKPIPTPRRVAAPVVAEAKASSGVSPWDDPLDSPETDSPETDSPETDSPETDSPETDSPETDSPETDSPETDSPETDSPETDSLETALDTTPATKEPAPLASPDLESPAIESPELESPKSDIAELLPSGTEITQTAGVASETSSGTETSSETRVD